MNLSVSEEMNCPGYKTCHTVTVAYHHHRDMLASKNRFMPKMFTTSSHQNFRRSPKLIPKLVSALVGSREIRRVVECISRRAQHHTRTPSKSYFKKLFNHESIDTSDQSTMSDKGILRKYKIVFLGDQSGMLFSR